MRLPSVFIGLTIFVFTQPSFSDHLEQECLFDRKTDIMKVYDDANDQGHTCLNIVLNETNIESQRFRLRDGVTLVCETLDFQMFTPAHIRDFVLDIENAHLNLDDLELIAELCFARPAS